MSQSPRPPAPGDRRSVPTVAVVLVGIAVVAVGIVLALVRGGDDDGGGDPAADRAGAFGTVSVDGTPLAELEAGVDDPAIGQAAPVLRAETPDGGEASVGGGGQPALVVFLAHWCPHCQAEVPLLVELARDGVFDGVRLVAVLTGTNPDAPNYPPAAWLAREGWPGEELLDDEEFTAARAYGLGSYPFLVALDGDGRVVARTSGEQPAETIEAMVDAARGAGGP